MPELASKEIERTELPPPETKHWVPHRKAAVVAAVRDGTLTLPEACERYRLTEEEFYSWTDAFDQRGLSGLRSTIQTERRAAIRQTVSEAGVAMLDATNSIPCLITDITDQGARIRFEKSVSLPRTLELRCKKSGRSWWVDVIWNRADVAGVRFSNPIPPPWTIRTGLGAWLLGQRRTVSIDRVDSL